VRRAALLAALVATAAAAVPAAGQERPRWDTRLLARIEPPGFPASAYPHPNGRVYVGTFTNPNGDTVPSRIFEFDDEGTLHRSWTVPGQDLSAEHGTQAATSDGDGRLVLLDRTPSRALLLDMETGEFTQYSDFADLPPCPPTELRNDCSPTTGDLPPVPNYAAWGPDGSLYVTDFQQGVVWRVPPGGGTAQVWLSDRKLDGERFGTTGIALASDQRTLLIAQGSSAGIIGLGGNPPTGKLYRSVIQPDGSPGPLEQIWESGPAELPDGFGIAQSGNVYIAMAGSNQIAVIAPDGRELERFPSSPDGSNGSPVPFDTPSSAKFLGTRVMVPNQSFTGNADNQALLDVETGEPGLPELRPAGSAEEDDVAPVLSRVSVRPRVVRLGALRRPLFTARRGDVRLRYRLSERAGVFVKLRRGGRTVRTFVRPSRRGVNGIRFSARPLAAGRYRVVFRATDRAGNRSSKVSRRLRVVR
jgi:sugar lactone lactonase YvrE